MHLSAKAAPPIDRNEQEQPNHINEMPIPRGRFKTEMVILGVMAFAGAQITHKQEYGSNKDVKAVKACRHEEC